jgi:hypothetical protein
LYKEKETHTRGKKNIVRKTTVFGRTQKNIGEKIQQKIS